MGEAAASSVGPDAGLIVEFHTGVPDTLDFACRLLRKAFRRGATVLCLVPEARLDALDRLLWTSVERDFVPHARWPAASESMRRRSPIWLATGWPAVGDAVLRDALVNLGCEAPLAPLRGAAAPLRRLEIVGDAPEEVERGRATWRRYKIAGFDVQHHPYRSADTS